MTEADKRLKQYMVAVMMYVHAEDEEHAADQFEDFYGKGVGSNINVIDEVRE